MIAALMSNGKATMTSVRAEICGCCQILSCAMMDTLTFPKPFALGEAVATQIIIITISKAAQVYNAAYAISKCAHASALK